MRQLYRLILSPRVFFNQLQWSSHHLFLVLLFGAFFFAELRFGAPSPLTQTLVHWISIRTHLSFEISRWLYAALGSLFGLGFAYLLSQAIWFIGTLLGERTSFRVLLRRLSVVYSVFILGLLLIRIQVLHPQLHLIAPILLAWGGFLALIALQEHFNFSLVQSALMVAIAATLVFGSAVGLRTAVQKYAGVHSLPLSKTLYHAHAPKNFKKKIKLKKKHRR